MIFYKNDENADKTINPVSTLLKEGRVGVLPCDTIYGLSAIYESGKEALMRVKGRSETKPFLALATLEQVRSLVKSVPGELVSLWPAQLTAVLELKTGGTQAFRVPDDDFLRAILERTGVPIYSTSVNMSGSPALLTFSDIEKAFSGKADFFVKGREEQGSMPSTLIDCTVRPFRILRQGAFKVPERLCERG